MLVLDCCTGACLNNQRKSVYLCCSRYLLFTFLTQCYFTMYGE
jgi:hypothetical protein